MTENENLIDRFDRWAAQPNTGSINQQRRMAEFATELRDALEAAEKALTPTDADEVISEREALSEASRRLSEGLDPDLRDGWTVLPDELLEDFRSVMAATRRWKAERFVPDWDMEAAARRVKAREDAVLHRTEVPEPSAEHECSWACGADKYGQDYHSEPQGEPSDLIQRLIDLRGDMRHNADEVATLDAAITALRGQGEPSDAQVEAAHEAFWASGDVTGGHDAIRAALRAANEVR